MNGTAGQEGETVRDVGADPAAVRHLATCCQRPPCPTLSATDPQGHLTGVTLVSDDSFPKP